MSEGYIYNILFLFLTLIIWFCSRYCYDVPRVLIRLFCAFWLINSTIIAAGFITYDVVLTIKSFLFISFYFLAGILGIYFGSGNFTYTHKFISSIEIKRPKLLPMFFMLIACFLFIGFFIKDLIIYLPMLITDFNALRNLFWDEWSQVTVPTLFDAIMAFVSGVAFFAALSYENKTQMGFLWLRYLALLVFFAFCLQSLMIGGRSVIFYIAFLLIYSYRVLYSNKTGYGFLNEKIKNAFISLFIVTAGLFFMVIFPTLRGAEYTSFDLFLSYRHVSEISAYIKVLDGYIPGVASLAFATDYFSTPMVKMTDLIETLETSNWYFFGAYSFSVPPKLISLVADVNYHQNARVILEEAIASQGYLAVRPWTTSAHDFAMDFGLVGAVIGVGFSTYILSRLYIYGLRARTGEGIALCSLIALCLIIFAFKSPFNITIIANSLFVGLFLFILSKVSFK